MRLTTIVAALGIIALTGCMNSQSEPLKKSGNEISDWPEFSLHSGVTFVEHIKRDDGSVALTTYDTSSTIRKSTDFSIHLYNNISSCQNTGVSTPKISEEDAVKTQWGYVDFFDKYNSGEGWLDYDGEPPPCRPPGLPGGAAYALCSEHNGKQVLICVSEVKDNPKLAEDIFQTFRWTDQ